MNSNQTNKHLLLSIIMTIIFPLVGCISLYYAITAKSQYKRNDKNYAITWQKAYKLTLSTGVTTIIASIGLIALLISLYACK